MTYKSVIIIGAPRSGTNMLRDILCSFEGVSTWPCDEINYIWRHGNLRFPSDEFSEELATPRSRKYIRKQFDWVAGKYGAHTVVEKTCANSLRVNFVNSIVEDAIFIHLIRDGLDASGSAKLRWKAGIDWLYTAKKARFVPTLDLPYYAGRYLLGHLSRFSSAEAHVKSWGPVLADQDELMKDHTLLEMCALQWRRCVEKAKSQMEYLPEERVIPLRYEDFVRNPALETSDLLERLGLPVPTRKHIELHVSKVSPKSVGRGRECLEEQDRDRLEPLIQETMNKLGYYF